MNHERIAQAIANLDAWLETMRQPGGYGGPVAHWWQNRFQYTGPGLDWRYEGILVGYATLAKKAPEDERWHRRLAAAAKDLIDGQRPDGGYLASRFEINPGSHGTPHEAAASLGLLVAAPFLDHQERALATAKRNLDHLVEQLWDGNGFADRPGGRERVPNKLATLGHAFITAAKTFGESAFHDYARACFDDVLRLQVPHGPGEGAIHQYAPDGSRGDGRFFPYYNARCVPPLLAAAGALGESRYRSAAESILGFLDRTVDEDGSWPQIIYQGGRSAPWPRWVAGGADISLAYVASGSPVPSAALGRILGAQQPTGAFPTGVGFGARVTQRMTAGPADLRDWVPVVGWNDKVLRLLSRLLPTGSVLPVAQVNDLREQGQVHGRAAVFDESSTSVNVASDLPAASFTWTKSAPWAAACGGLVNVR